MRWAENDQEKQHITNILLKATHTAGRVANVMMKNGAFKQGTIHKSGTSLSNDLTTNRGYVILEDSSGSKEELDVLDIQHIQ